MGLTMAVAELADPPRAVQGVVSIHVATSLVKPTRDKSWVNKGLGVTDEHTAGARQCSSSNWLHLGGQIKALADAKLPLRLTPYQRTSSPNGAGTKSDVERIGESHRGEIIGLVPEPNHTAE